MTQAALAALVVLGSTGPAEVTIATDSGNTKYHRPDETVRIRLEGGVQFTDYT